MITLKRILLSILFTAVCPWAVYLGIHQVYQGTGRGATVNHSATLPSQGAANENCMSIANRLGHMKFQSDADAAARACATASTDCIAEICKTWSKCAHTSDFLRHAYSCSAPGPTVIVVDHFATGKKHRN